MKKIIPCTKKIGDYSLINKSERDYIIQNITDNEKLENYLFPKYAGYQIKDLFDYLNFSFLLLLDFKEKEILNVGCGEGAESIFFAKFGAKKVYSFDLNPDRLKMLKANAKKNKIDNKIETIIGDFKKSKFLKNSFDIITMIGVFEWMPEKKPSQEHTIILKKVHHSLKNKGKFLMAIENRTNPTYFIGKTHHQDLPFTPLMPRFLANIINYLVRGKPYITYTYTRKEYINLFKKTGFKNIKIYPVLFSYQEPKYILNSNQIYRILLNKYGINPIMNTFAKILSMLPTHILNNLAPAFVIIGEK